MNHQLSADNFTTFTAHSTVSNENYVAIQMEILDGFNAFKAPSYVRNRDERKAYSNLQKERVKAILSEKAKTGNQYQIDSMVRPIKFQDITTEEWLKKYENKNKKENNIMANNEKIKTLQKQLKEAENASKKAYEKYASGNGSLEEVLKCEAAEVSIEMELQDARARKEA